MKIDKSLMSGSTTLLILSLLVGEEMYGYQMITELAQIGRASCRERVSWYV